MDKFEQIFNKWKNGETDLAPVTKLLGIKPIEYKKGSAKVAIEVGPLHHNALGTVHGGILTDLADVAFGVAIATTIKIGQGFTTLDIHICYIRPVKKAILIASAKVVHQGRTRAYLECEIHNEDGKLVAKANSNYMILS